MQKISFPRASFGDLLLNEKQEKPFVLLDSEVTKAWHLLLVVQYTSLYSYNYANLLLLLG